MHRRAVAHSGRFHDNPLISAIALEQRASPPHEPRCRSPSDANGRRALAQVEICSTSPSALGPRTTACAVDAVIGVFWPTAIWKATLVQGQSVLVEATNVLAADSIQGAPDAPDALSRTFERVEIGVSALGTPHKPVRGTARRVSLARPQGPGKRYALAHCSASRGGQAQVRSRCAGDMICFIMNGPESLGIDHRPRGALRTTPSSYFATLSHNGTQGDPEPWRERVVHRSFRYAMNAGLRAWGSGSGQTQAVRRAFRSFAFYTTPAATGAAAAALWAISVFRGPLLDLSRSSEVPGHPAGPRRHHAGVLRDTGAVNGSASAAFGYDARQAFETGRSPMSPRHHSFPCPRPS